MRLPKASVAGELHRTMVRIRHFEEAAGNLMESGRVPGGLHLYVGQEAVAAGIISSLSASDQITQHAQRPRPFDSKRRQPSPYVR